MAEHLQVWRGAHRVGELLLTSDKRTMAFTYADPIPGLAISNSLPLATKSFDHWDLRAHNWFANLLPEEGARQALATRLGLPDTDFDLLATLAGDCPGAVRLIPDGIAPEEPAGRRQIDLEALGQWASGKERYALYGAGNLSDTRLTLPGNQDKIPALAQNGKLYLPTGSQASSHLLKFAPWSSLIINELYLTHLARAASVPAAWTQVGRTDQGLYLLVRRYDRQYDEAGNLQRLHQEDLCQALGLPSAQKREANSGPSLAACAALLRGITHHPDQQVEQLLQWQMFNVLTGNCDGHAKNLSVIQDAGGNWALAPAYDLMCTLPFTHDRHLAFAVGGNHDPEKITPAEWEALATDMGVSPPRALRMLAGLAQQLRELADSDELRESMEKAWMAEGEWDKVKLVRQLVCQQCDRTLENLAEVGVNPGFDPAELDQQMGSNAVTLG